MPLTLNETKKMYAEQLLCCGTMMIHMNAQHEGVVVPQEHKWDNQLRLSVDLPSVSVTDEGIRGVLSFSTGDFECFVPWEAIWALTLPHDLHKGMFWEESLPYEVKVFLASANIPTPPEATVTPNLRVIEGGSDIQDPKRKKLLN